MIFRRLRVASSNAVHAQQGPRTPDKFCVWVQRCGTVIEETRGMAELLGARIFLEAMRETRHGRIREQQVNRDRYTGAYYGYR